MEERDTSQLEMLAKIHNQMVDLKQILVSIELARPDAPESLKTRLRQLVEADEHIDAGGHSGAAETRQQKVIAPVDTDIQPGEGRTN